MVQMQAGVERITCYASTFISDICLLLLSHILLMTDNAKEYWPTYIYDQ